MTVRTEQDIRTRLAHAGVFHSEPTGAVSTPIYQTATYRHPALGQSTGYDYSRTSNPTRAALESCIADLEGGARGFAFASGMAAITSVLLLFEPGDHLVVSEDLYGGTYRLLEHVFASFNLSASYVDGTDIVKVAAAVRPNTRALLVETPGNPLMRVSDLKALADLAHSAKVLAIVDNTFMTPYLQRPLELGWDLVIHSASKFLAGHNDVVAGLAVARESDLAERLAFVQNAAGAVLGPQDSWLTLRGIKTLALRMDRAQQNASRIAEWLQAHPSVSAVHYPGLPDHPGHKTHHQQAAGSGAMISFSVHDPDVVGRALSRLRLIAFAESLGGVESLITFPARQTHADMPADVRERLGVTYRLLRLSVGIEAIDDLIEDLAQALA